MLARGCAREAHVLFDSAAVERADVFARADDGWTPVAAETARDVCVVRVAPLAAVRDPTYFLRKLAVAERRLDEQEGVVE